MLQSLGKGGFVVLVKNIDRLGDLTQGSELSVRIAIRGLWGRRIAGQILNSMSFPDRHGCAHGCCRDHLPNRPPDPGATVVARRHCNHHIDRGFPSSLYHQKNEMNLAEILILGARQHHLKILMVLHTELLFPRPQVHTLAFSTALIATALS